MQVCTHAMRMPGLTLAPSITQSPPQPLPAPSSGANSCGKDVLFQAAGGGDVRLRPRWAGRGMTPQGCDPCPVLGTEQLAQHGAKELTALYSEI